MTWRSRILTDNLQLEAVRIILNAVGSESVVLIGAHALGAWGVPRGTKDIDFATDQKPETITAKLVAAGIEAKVNHGEYGDPIAWAIRGNVKGVPFDILPPMEDLSVSEGIEVDFKLFKARVCRLNDLIRLKFYAGGPGDILDVVNLARVRPDIIPYAQVQADRYDCRKEFDIFLERVQQREQQKPENRRKRQ